MQVEYTSEEAYSIYQVASSVQNHNDYYMRDIEGEQHAQMMNHKIDQWIVEWGYPRWT